MDGRLSLGPDGRLLLTRPPLPGEAARLGRLAGLDVPALVADDGAAITVTWAPPLLDGVPAVAASLAATLAAAHARGEAHGPLEPDHLRTGLLDGWAGGEPADDVEAFGRLLLDAGPLPPALEVVARRAVAADPAARPTMAAVAEALAPPPPPAVVARPRRQWSVPAWLPAAVAAPIALAAVLLTTGDPSPAPRPTSAVTTTSSTSTTAFTARPYEGVSPP